MKLQTLKEFQFYISSIKTDYLNSSNPGIPNGVLVITAMVDVQAGSGPKPARLEYEAWGWGTGEEGWIVDKKVIAGDVYAVETWQKLDDYITDKHYTRKDGLKIPLTICFLDSGFAAQQVYEFTARRFPFLFATKGSNKYGAPLIPKVNKVNWMNNNKSPLVYVGTQEAKAEIFGRINLYYSKESKAVKGGNKYLHFTKEFCDVEYFDQLTAEHAVPISTFQFYISSIKTPPKITPFLAVFQ
jgi:terminase, large subunit